ncbi:hypothetical protein LINPERHAP2_LOCUS29040 [Linum perenne]
MAPWQTPSTAVFDSLRLVPFWVRLDDVPFEFRTPSFIFGFLSLIGHVSDAGLFDSRHEVGVFLRGLVRVDVVKPIEGRLKAHPSPDQDFWVRLRYEGLPLVCYWWGLLGHGIKRCPSNPASVERSPDRDYRISVRKLRGGRRVLRSTVALPSTAALVNHSVPPIIGMSRTDASLVCSPLVLPVTVPPIASSPLLVEKLPHADGLFRPGKQLRLEGLHDLGLDDSVSSIDTIFSAQTAPADLGCPSLPGFGSNFGCSSPTTSVSSFHQLMGSSAQVTLGMDNLHISNPEADIGATMVDQSGDLHAVILSSSSLEMVSGPNLTRAANEP